MRFSLVRHLTLSHWPLHFWKIPSISVSYSSCQILGTSACAYPEGRACSISCYEASEISRVGSIDCMPFVEMKGLFSLLPMSRAELISHVIDDLICALPCLLRLLWCVNDSFSWCLHHLRSIVLSSQCYILGHLISFPRWFPWQVRAFDFRSGKLRRKYDESRRAMENMIAEGQLKMDAMDLGKKSAVEKELEVWNKHHTSN